MKILFTAEYDASMMDEINALGEVRMDGWAIGLPKMSEEELKEKAKDADIIITSYDDITKGRHRRGAEPQADRLHQGHPRQHRLRLCQGEGHPRGVHPRPQLRLRG